MADWGEWRPYVPVAQRRAQAQREIQRRLKKGTKPSPVVIEGRAIATTFWGKAWCDNLERYSDFANRLPRGRTYARNGSVVHLEVTPGVVNAFVGGSDVYEIKVKVAPVPEARWKSVCQDCSGAIESLVELLQGRFSHGVMSRICQQQTGLFPSPKELQFECSCPDWASMCKHVAAVLYGIGSRLDSKPEMLFLLRGVNQMDLIAGAGKDMPKAKTPAGKKVLAAEGLSDIFGIEIADESAVAKTAATRKQTTKKARTAKARKARKAPRSG